MFGVSNKMKVRKNIDHEILIKMIYLLLLYIYIYDNSYVSSIIFASFYNYIKSIYIINVIFLDIIFRHKYSLLKFRKIYVNNLKQSYKYKYNIKNIFNVS